MRRRVLIASAAAVVVAAAVVITVVATHRPDGAGDRNFVVAGRAYSCGTSGRVRLEMSLGGNGPAAYFSIDGQRQPQLLDRTGYGLHMAVTPVYSCADNTTHTVHIESDYIRPEFAACAIRLLPDVQHRVGYNSADYPGWDNGDYGCDASWTD